jgi:hypothetical protein
VILVHVGGGEDVHGNGEENKGILSFSLTTAIAILSLGPIIEALANGQNFQLGRRISVRVGAALLSLLYKKSLTVDLSEIPNGPGSVNNLISVGTDIYI